MLLQPKLNLRVSQKQILTPGLVQMVSVLALNKLELKEMINAEIIENPVLEELETPIPLLDDVHAKEADRERADAVEEPVAAGEPKDPFDEIDFGSYFQEYLDPGFRTHNEIEQSEKPSFENFLSKPSTLYDHLNWQLGAMNLRPELREAAELVIGNLNEDGYLIASEDELLGVVPIREVQLTEVQAIGHEGFAESLDSEGLDGEAGGSLGEIGDLDDVSGLAYESEPRQRMVEIPSRVAEILTMPRVEPRFGVEALREAIQIVRQLDPVGIAARDLRECLLSQLQYLLLQINRRKHHEASADVHPAAVPHMPGESAVGGEYNVAGGVEHVSANGHVRPTGSQELVINDAMAIVDAHLRGLQAKQYKEIARAIGRPIEAVMTALDLIKSLDPRPGQRYNNSSPRLIEPDVAFVKQSDEYVVMMNEDDVPTLRLNPGYRKLLGRDSERDVRSYLKERYKSAIQLIKNIEQRKQTILKTCYAIINRQRDFLDRGVDCLKPMMIKEVAEEIGVHPSTVSRAVANKYVHTPQGVFELRFFFSESVNGPEGGGTSLMILKRRVKKLIEEEDIRKPLTDDQLARILQTQGIQVTRRTVAKYREDMRIPSTHQRRMKN